jgi:hypothetical protein
VVVDSDEGKAGSYVPGLGQCIQPARVLLEHPVDVIIVPTQWRAKDIVEEAQRMGIVYERLLIPHEGRLVDYHSPDQPYDFTPADSSWKSAPAVEPISNPSSAVPV